MHTSALSLAISIPATTTPFCAIIQLPSLLGPGSKPMQLFGLRKTPGLSLAPRQALAAFEHHGLRSSDGRLVRTARSYILADFADTRARHKPLKPLRAGMPGDSGVLVVTRVRSITAIAHEAAGATGIRHSPRPRLGRKINQRLGRFAPRARSRMWTCRRCEERQRRSNPYFLR